MIYANSLQSTFSSVSIASLYALAFAYAGTAKEVTKSMLVKALEGPIEVAAAAAISAGLIFEGVLDEELINAVLKRVFEVTEENENDMNSLMLGYGYAMFYTGLELEWESQSGLLGEMAKLPSRYQQYLEVAFLSTSFLGTQNILVVHKLLEKLSKEEEIIEKEKKEEKDKQKSPNEKEKKTDGEATSLLSSLGGLGGLGGLISPMSNSTPKESSATEKEDDDYHIKMIVMAIALVACGEGVNSSMITRLLELLQVYSSKSANEVVLLAMAILSPSTPSVSMVDQIIRKTAGGMEANKTNSSAYRACVNSVLALGILSAGSGNTKINTHLKQLIEGEKLYHYMNCNEYTATKGFYIHFAQGLLQLGRGLLSLSPFYEEGMLVKKTSILFLMSSLLPRLCNKCQVGTNMVMLMMLIMGAVRPRLMMLLDSKHENTLLKTNVRVGQAVDVTGQAGVTRNISGFQTMEDPVLVAPGERAVIANAEEYSVSTRYLDGFVFAEEKK